MDNNNYDGNQPYNTGAPQYNPIQPVKQGLSVGEWMLTLFLTGIPCVGIIMLFVWAFGDENERKNYARAALIWALIGIVVAIILNILLAALGASIMNSYN